MFLVGTVATVLPMAKALMVLHMAKASMALHMAMVLMVPPVVMAFTVLHFNGINNGRNGIDNAFVAQKH